MSKELPYFRFTVGEWLNGDIAYEEDSIKGVFVDACAFYWFKSCNVTEAMLKLRFQNREKAIDLLMEKGIIKMVKESNIIIISFLDEQWGNLLELRRVRQEAGRKGGQAKLKPSLSKAKAKVKQSLSYKDKDKDRDDKEKKDLHTSFSLKQDTLLLKEHTFLKPFLTPSTLEQSIDKEGKLDVGSEKIEDEKDQKKVQDSGQKKVKKKCVSLSKSIKVEEQKEGEEKVSGDEQEESDVDNDEEKLIRRQSLEKAEESECRELLSEYLSLSQLQGVMKRCKLTTEYVKEKIRILKMQERENPAAFLYTALVQDYRPAETLKIGEEKKTHRLVRKAKSCPLSEEEFEEVPEDLKMLFKAEDHIVPEDSIFKLVSKPQEGGNAIERAIFFEMEMGSTIEKKQFDQLSERHQRHFESVNRPIGTIKKFHLR